MHLLFYIAINGGLITVWWLPEAGSLVHIRPDVLGYRPGALHPAFVSHTPTSCREGVSRLRGQRYTVSTSLMKQRIRAFPSREALFHIFHQLLRGGA